MELKPGYKQTEVGVIPEEWYVKPLDLVLIKGRLGGNYPNQDREATYPLMKMGNIARGYIDTSKIEYISPGNTPDPNDRLRYGDVLFNTRNTLDLVGKVAIWRDELPVAYYNSNLMRLEFDPKEVCSNEYANYVLNSNGGVTRLRALATGTTSVAAIYTRDLLQMPFIVPPPPEQRAIAGALTDVDALIGALDQLIAKKRDLKQAAMQQLLTGQTRLPGFHGKWRVMELGELCDYVDGITTLGGDLGYLEIGDVNVDTKSYDVAQKEKLSVRGAVKVPAGTLLISTVRPTRGAIVITKSSLHVSSAFCCVRPTNGLLFHLVCQPIFLAYLGENSFGGTYPTCRDGTILGYESPLPTDPAEQTAIAEVLSEMDAELAALTQRRDKTRALKQGMMQELLTGRIRLV